MDKEALRANRQKALIQDTLRAALKGTQGSDGPTLHPFIIAVQTLKREIEFMDPFKESELFAGVEKLYKSATDLSQKASNLIYGEADVSPDADQLLSLVEYHANLLKIHRVLLSRAVEGTSLIPAAPPSLQKQVGKAYEALGQLGSVLKALSQTPKPPPKRAERRQPRAIARRPEPLEDPMDLPLRVSPFITEGPRKGTVLIDGALWPRYV